MDINTAIKRILKTGKVSLGSKTSINHVKNGKAKAVLIPKNCPKELRQDIEQYCGISKTPLISFEGSSKQLGELCGKPFLVSMLTILNPGDVSINNLMKEADK